MFSKKSICQFLIILSITLLHCNLKKPNDPKSDMNKWTPLNSELTSLHAQFINIDPNETNVLYVSTFDGIFSSLNGGKSWNIANKGMTSNDVQMLICNPKYSDQIYAGTWGDGIFLSEDRATNWYSINNNISDLRIRSITIDPDSPTNIFAAASTQIVKSTNNGTTWQTIKRPPGKIRSMAVDFRQNTIFIGTDYTGIHSSSDNGITWNEISSGLPYASEGYYYPIVDLKLAFGGLISMWVAIEGRGIFNSQNNGQTWQPYNDGLTSKSVQCLVISEKKGLIITGTKSGIFISSSSEQTWKKMNEGLTHLDVRAVAIDPKDSKIIYAGTMGGGVFKMILE